MLRRETRIVLFLRYVIQRNMYTCLHIIGTETVVYEPM